ATRQPAPAAQSPAPEPALADHAADAAGLLAEPSGEREPSVSREAAQAPAIGPPPAPDSRPVMLSVRRAEASAPSARAGKPVTLERFPRQPPGVPPPAESVRPEAPRSLLRRVLNRIAPRRRPQQADSPTAGPSPVARPAGQPGTAQPIRRT